MIYLLDELINGIAREQYGLDLSARQIFRSITSQDGRVKLMRNLLETLPHNKSKSLRYDEMINEFASINSQAEQVRSWHLDYRFRNRKSHASQGNHTARSLRKRCRCLARRGPSAYEQNASLVHARGR